MNSSAVLQKLKVPAILLIVFGVCTDLVGLWNIASSALGIGYDESQIPPGMEEFMGFMKSFGVVFGVLQLASGAVMLLGGLNMMRGRGYGLAMTAAVLAMIPMLNCCCILTLPFGLWALIVLLKPEVKAAFHSAS
ncbi:MAG: hypothetical protein HZA53_05550 [Planctomycetes bacterium]|nr:hypothetical protein [Planctomycetota bacterium]